MNTLSYRNAGLLTTSLLLAGVGALSPASVHALGADTCSFGGNVEFPLCSSFTFDKQVDKTLKVIKAPTAGFWHGSVHRANQERLGGGCGFHSRFDCLC